MNGQNSEESPVPDASLAGDDLLERVTREIAAEVSRRRASGELPAEFERELDEAFERLVPGPAKATSLARQAVMALQESVSFDAQVPIGSRIPGGAAVKRVVARLVGWYVGYYASHLTSSERATARALDRVVEDLEDLRSLVAPEGPGVATGPPGDRREAFFAWWAPTMPRWWQEHALEAMPSFEGPVVHTVAGRGELVAEFCRHGLDAYGIEPDESAVAEARAGGLDVRRGEPSAHLRGLEAGTSRAVILEGVVQWASPGERYGLLSLAASALAPGGRLIVVSMTPLAWYREGEPVLLDLAPGRPIHAETWRQLTRSVGLVPVSVHEGGLDRRIVLGSGAPSVTGDADGPETLASVVRELNRLLGGPDEYLVVAERPR